MTNDAEGSRVRIPEIVHTKWDEMLDAYNPIIVKLNQITRQSSSFKSTSGKIVGCAELASRMESVSYKLYWACKSLEYLVEYYENRTKSLDESIRSMTEELPAALFFNLDVFFCFGYSALDFVAEIIHMLVSDGLKESNVYLTTVLNSLTSLMSTYEDRKLNEVREASDTGWIHEFRQYRNFVTHHGLIQPTPSQYRYTASEHTFEVNFCILPDNPKEKKPTYQKKREFEPYCLEVIVKELEAIATLFGFIGKIIPM